MDEYSLSDAYVPVGGANVKGKVYDFAAKTVGKHYVIAFVMILVLTIMVLWLALWKCKEHFNPTQNLRDQDSDQFGLGHREYMDGDRGKSVFAQQVQDGAGGQYIVDPSAKANQPGSLAWQVLHSSDFNCDKRVMAGDDAWAWMNGVAHESMSSNKPQSDNDFSKVLAGN